MPDECRHELSREVVTEHLVCRYIPAGWERDDDDPFETVVLKDRAVFCVECGELLDFSAGD